MSWEYVEVAVLRHRWPAVFKTLKLDKRPVHHIERSGATVAFVTTTKGLELIQSRCPGAVVEHYAAEHG